MRNINIIGAGLTGLTIARVLADNGIKCTVIEKRDKIGGNCSSHYENEIEVHEYGPHVFHTDSEFIWNFINRFSKFNGFVLNVLSNVHGKLYHLPFGLDLINSFFDKNIKPNELQDFLDSLKDKNIKSPKNLEEQAISLVGKEIYYNFIYGYTKKQWGTEPKNLPSFIIKRIPFRNNYNNNYFNDMYQGIPLQGYQKLFENMIDSENIHTILNRDVSIDDMDDKDIYIYSGQIDKLLKYKYGFLDWRSLRFEFEKLDISDYQGNVFINFPDENVPYTRIHEYKYFHNEIDYKNKNTIIGREFPEKYTEYTEPYYPIENDKNMKIYDMYMKDILENHKNIIMCGRLGKYKYFDMDDAISDAIKVATDIIKSVKKLCK